MRRYQMTLAAAAAAMLLCSQPVFSAQAGVISNEAPVITAGAGSVQAGGAPGAVQDEPTAAPGENAALAQEQEAAPSAAPLIGDGTAVSPVLIAGSGQANAAADSQQAGGEAAPEQNDSVEAAPSGALTPVAQEGQNEENNTQSGGRRVDPSKPMVALTFDDGPQASVGNRIMDSLAQYGGKATFFLVGDRVSAHRAEVQRMAAEGHELANHTMNHKYLQKLGAAEVQAQVNRANDAIESVSGVRPRIMRLPGGNSSATVRANTHMPMIQWSIDTLDWKTRNADKTVAAVLNNVKDGDIILMHELYSQSGDAAVRLIPELTSRGYQLVTVSEMAAAKGYGLEAGKLYSALR